MNELADTLEWVLEAYGRIIVLELSAGIKRLFGEFFADESLLPRGERLTEKKLLEIQWWNWDMDKIQENLELFYNPCKFVEKFS